MSFIEEALIDPLSWGFSGGPTWSTRRVSLRNGMTRRNIERTRPLHRFVGAFDKRDPEVFEALLRVFNACHGGAYGFRFKNPMDYAVANEALGIAAGGTQTLQLTRSFRFGAQETVVPVRKPVPDDFVLTADGSPLAATLNPTTGEVTFTTDAGAALAWSGEFDLPVFFSSDDFTATLDTWNATTVEVVLEEDLSA